MPIREEENETETKTKDETETNTEIKREDTEKKDKPNGYVDLSIVSLKAVIGFIVFMIVYILLMVFL